MVIPHTRLISLLVEPSVCLFFKIQYNFRYTVGTFQVHLGIKSVLWSLEITFLQ